MPTVGGPAIHLAFRFHANFYHSYRGDTPDELGFGKDIRIIRHIIQVLDGFNAQGVPVRATWDIDNYYSLERIIPRHCPDILRAWQRRVADGRDEFEVMSYNNGLMSAHTAAEFDAAIGRALHNDAGSGLQDLFAEYAPIVRPQEMMFTPMHLRLYPRHGIRCISLFYSAVPFNAFSNFVPPLPLEQRYNPVTLACPGMTETMTLVPAANHGDILDNLSLRRWLRRLRRQQLALEKPADLLLVIDADADDEYWSGYPIPVVGGLLAGTGGRGLAGLIESVCDLDYVVFTTPGAYVETHPPIATVVFGQDTADGSFDGYASWAEKWSNHALWTGIERARVLELQTRRLLKGAQPSKDTVQARRWLAESFDARVRALSTTHFGLTAPVMNVARLRGAAAMVDEAVQRAARAFAAARGAAPRDGDFTLVNYVRGVSTEPVQYRPAPSRALVRLRVTSSDVCNLQDGAGRALPVAVYADADRGSRELLFVTRMEGEDSKSFRCVASGEREVAAPPDTAVSLDGRTLRNAVVELQFDDHWHLVGLAHESGQFADGRFVRSAVNYAGRVVEVRQWRVKRAEVLGDGLLGVLLLQAELSLPKTRGRRVAIEREFLLAAGLPYVYLRTHVAYPDTRSRTFSRERARRLQREYDGRWREVMPCELRPALAGTDQRPLRVWKHDYCEHVSHYDLNYGAFSKNGHADSLNNHVTHAWVALSDRRRGLLVAQTVDAAASIAFCPMRLRPHGDATRAYLNPFGCYYGKQWDYMTAHTGLGRWVSVLAVDTLDSQAASYGGHTEEIALLIAPYLGDAPPESVRNDALAFAYPYAVVAHSPVVAPPPHAAWRMAAAQDD